MARNYKKEYAYYGSKTVDDRSSRNKARRKAKKIYGEKALRGKDVHHKNGNPRDNSRDNLRIRKRSVNRADKRK